MDEHGTTTYRVHTLMTSWVPVALAITFSLAALAGSYWAIQATGWAVDRPIKVAGLVAIPAALLIKKVVFGASRTLIEVTMGPHSIRARSAETGLLKAYDREIPWGEISKFFIGPSTPLDEVAQFVIHGQRSKLKILRPIDLEVGDDDYPLMVVHFEQRIAHLNAGTGPARQVQRKPTLFESAWAWVFTLLWVGVAAFATGVFFYQGNPWILVYTAVAMGMATWFLVLTLRGRKTRPR